MAATILDGKAIAADLKAELSAAAAEFAARHGAPPLLAVVQVAGDEASDWYVRSIKRSCEGAGFGFHHHLLQPDTSQEQIERRIRDLNADPEVHGIVIQMPLPAHISAEALASLLDPRKDVDGLHPVNAGRLLLGQDCLVPNTPAGGMEILRRYAISIAGRRAVVVGRSNIVGKPMALLLLREHATVTICHSRTPDLSAAIREADIVAVAVGKPGVVTGAMLKPGAVVLDFGINSGPDGRVTGDVDFASASEVAGAITPVPGGTGPITTMMLLRNTLQAARWQREAQ